MKRLLFLDGLRGLCALYVLVYHAYVELQGDLAKPGALGALWNTLLYGHFAVTLFLVLSGFCLGLTVLDDKPIQYWQFIKRRCHRILPPYYGAVVLSILPAVVIWHQFGLTWKATPEQWAINLLLLNDFYTTGGSFALTFWSIAVEFRIYFLFPLLVWLFRRYGTIAALSFAALTCLGSYGFTTFLRTFNPNIHYACNWYGIVFCFGFLAAQRAIRFTPLWTAASLAALIAQLLLYPHPSATTAIEQSFGRHLLGVDLAFGLLAACCLQTKQGTDAKVLNHPVTLWLGSFSYSIYLLHWQTLQVLRHRFDRLGLPVAFAIDVGICLVVAYGFFWICERPFLQAMGSVKAPPLLSKK